MDAMKVAVEAHDLADSFEGRDKREIVVLLSTALANAVADLADNAGAVPAIVDSLHPVIVHQAQAQIAFVEQLERVGAGR